jgi:hypothetical protein
MTRHLASRHADPDAPSAAANGSANATMRTRVATTGRAPWGARSRPCRIDQDVRDRPRELQSHPSGAADNKRRPWRHLGYLADDGNVAALLGHERDLLLETLTALPLHEAHREMVAEGSSSRQGAQPEPVRIIASSATP